MATFKLGLGLYAHMLNEDHYRFARQCGASEVVVHLVDYFAGSDLNSDDQPVGGSGGWGVAGHSTERWALPALLTLKADVERSGLNIAAIENFDPAHWHDILRTCGIQITFRINRFDIPPRRKLVQTGVLAFFRPRATKPSVRLSRIDHAGIGEISGIKVRRCHLRVFEIGAQIFQPLILGEQALLHMTGNLCDIEGRVAGGEFNQLFCRCCRSGICSAPTAMPVISSNSAWCRCKRSERGKNNLDTFALEALPWRRSRSARLCGG